MAESECETPSTPGEFESKYFEYHGVRLPPFCRGKMEEIANFPVRVNDVWIVTYPKSGREEGEFAGMTTHFYVLWQQQCLGVDLCDGGHHQLNRYLSGGNMEKIVENFVIQGGTSLLQEVVYLVSQGADPDEIGLMNIDEQLPVLEYPQPGLDIIKELTSPRLIKSHLPYRFLPSDLHNGNSKVIYMARNPKDLVVSYYQFHRSLRTMSYRGTFQEFCRRFMNDKLGYGSWFEHVQEFWEHHMDSNVLFLKYEDMHKNEPQKRSIFTIYRGELLVAKRSWNPWWNIVTNSLTSAVMQKPFLLAGLIDLYSEENSLLEFLTFVPCPSQITVSGISSQIQDELGYGKISSLSP
uniref:Sulfotransferase 4A1 n=1 Tax=Sphaerodactylus townsendi TaxID=933632 RepID=A0ACB8FRG2_9SAUR